SISPCSQIICPDGQVTFKVVVSSGGVTWSVLGFGQVSLPLGIAPQRTVETALPPARTTTVVTGVPLTRTTCVVNPWPEAPSSRPPTNPRTVHVCEDLLTSTSGPKREPAAPWIEPKWPVRSAVWQRGGATATSAGGGAGRASMAGA